MQAHAGSCRTIAFRCLAQLSDQLATSTQNTGATRACSDGGVPADHNADEPEQRSDVAWFRYCGWLTVEGSAGSILAISPRTLTTPFWLFAVGNGTVAVLGGAWDLLMVLALAESLLDDPADLDAWWSRARRQGWAADEPSRAQYGLLRGLGTTKLDRAYAMRSKGMASSMIGHFKARRALEAQGRWWADWLEAHQVADWTAAALTHALIASGQDVAIAFPDQDQGLGDPSAIPYCQTNATRSVVQWLVQDEPVMVGVSDGCGLSRVLQHEVRFMAGTIVCDLQDVRAERRVLMALTAAFVGGARTLRGGSTAEVGAWLERMIDAFSAEHGLPPTIVIDHCRALSQEMAGRLQGFVHDRNVHLRCVATTPSRAGRIAAMLNLDVPVWLMDGLSKVELEQHVLPQLLAGAGLMCEYDEIPWVADELWAWAGGNPRQDVRWRTLAPCWVHGIQAAHRNDVTIIDQALVQRVRAMTQRSA
jgi:hypothetical protein